MERKKRQLNKYDIFKYTLNYECSIQQRRTLKWFHLHIH
jgi:hypothetical protein